MESSDDSVWTSARLASVEPQWTPDLVRAQGNLRSRLMRRRRSPFLVPALVAASLAVAALTIPQTRALAHDVWFRLFLNRVDVIRLQLSEIPLDMKVTVQAMETSVPDIQQAGIKAGFTPRLPSPEVLGGTVQLGVIGQYTVEQTVRTAKIRAALAKFGVNDIQVPREWDGVTLRANLGPAVLARYPGEVTILQAKPVEVFVPAGFSIPQFAETAFRSVGLSRAEARALGQRFAAQPGLVLGIPADEVVRLEEINLSTGPGLIIEDYGDNGSLERVTLIYNTPDRIYCISAPGRDTCVRVAGSIKP